MPANMPKRVKFRKAQKGSRARKRDARKHRVVR